MIIIHDTESFMVSVLFSALLAAEAVVPRMFVYGMIALAVVFIAFVVTYVLFLIQNRGTDFKGKK